jgi:hypothetical protein
VQKSDLFDSSGIAVSHNEELAFGEDNSRRKSAVSGDDDDDDEEDEEEMESAEEKKLRLAKKMIAKIQGVSHLISCHCVCLCLFK